jgi:death on curing protein
VASRGGEVAYLTADDVIALHAMAMGISETEAAARLRSREGLESATARPLWHARYGQADLPRQAAVLAHGIAETQLFIDGNKRTAWIALRTFLVVNGYDVTATQSERASWILELSRGASPDDLAAHLRTALIPLPPRP